MPPAPVSRPGITAHTQPQITSWPDNQTTLFQKPPPLPPRPPIQRQPWFTRRWPMVAAGCLLALLSFGLVLWLSDLFLIGQNDSAGEPKKMASGSAARNGVGAAGLAPGGDTPAELPPGTTSMTLGQNPLSVLDGFYDALADLEQGRRKRPVTILHLGDDHVSGDRLDAHLRALFQARFGDAGRGLLLPAGAFKGYRARGVRFGVEGPWSTASILDTKSGVFGLTGVQVSATSAKSEISVTSLDGPFDGAEVAFLASPDRGAASILVDGKSYSVATRANEPGVQRFRINLGGSTLAVRPAGTGPITVLSWSLTKNQAGIRYASIGLPGARADTPGRADELVMTEEVRALRPDLIVLGYGQVEGFDDQLDVGRYAQRVQELIARIKGLAPEASLLLIGPADAARMPDHAAKPLRQSPTAACRALSQEERQGYARLIVAEDARLARWYPPPRLEDVRLVLQRAALRDGAYYWDWSQIMGGACGIHMWAHAKPELALPDHLHLSDEGYQRSAKALFSELIQGYSAQRQLAGPVPGSVTRK